MVVSEQENILRDLLSTAARDTMLLRDCIPIDSDLVFGVFETVKKEFLIVNSCRSAGLRWHVEICDWSVEFMFKGWFAWRMSYKMDSSAVG